MYLDPSEGKAGASLETIYGAALSGALKVDPHTGEATLKFLNDIRDLVDQLSRTAGRVTVATPLGGGFGQEIGEFNQRLAAGGANSVREQLTTFRRELDRLTEAVTLSMRSYRTMDAAGAQALSGTGR